MARKRKSPVTTRQGRKNIKNIGDGLLQNQHGVTFTEEEKRKLINEVKKANYRHNKQVSEADLTPRKVGGKETGMTIGEMRKIMGKEPDWIVTKKTASMQRFRSREQFENYLSYLQDVNSDGYVEKRLKEYKRNYSKALDEAFGEGAKDIKMKIRMTKPEVFEKLIKENEELEIGYIYEAETDYKYANADLTEAANRIRAALGMKLK